MFTKSKWLAGLAATALAVSLSPLIGVSSAGAAERPDSLGKDFWVAFTQNYSGTPGVVVVHQRADGHQWHGVGAGDRILAGLQCDAGSGYDRQPCPSGAQLGDGGSGNPENRAIHVTANDEVSVYGLNRIVFTTDAFLGLPVDVLTTEYVVPRLPRVAQFAPSQFAVVASEDGTDVTYTPTADTTSGVTAGTATTKTLNKGEALPVSSNAGDLSGTHDHVHQTGGGDGGPGVRRRPEHVVWRVRLSWWSSSRAPGPGASRS